MSIYFSKFDLNTYRLTPYFQAQLPEGYPLDQVMLQCRAYRRLPPNLRKLSSLSKQWVARVWGSVDIGGITRYYDSMGNELNPETGQPLTDAEIDVQWPNYLVTANPATASDIPIPADGFPDPLTWEEPAPIPETIDVDEQDIPTKKQLLDWIVSRGRGAVAREYGLQLSSIGPAAISSDAELADLIINERKASLSTTSSSNKIQ